MTKRGQPHTRGRWVPALWIAGTLTLISPTLGQQTSVTPRPRVGLALAGGSALGLAHLGVLEWLEEHRIPIDVIAGTSMGGLVSGTYATGMTPAEMRALLKGVNWGEALAAEPPYQILDFRRREDRRAVPARVELGVRRGPRLPGGLSPAHPVGLLLSRVSLGYSDLESFDDLPIPFRCMAVDMATGSRSRSKTAPWRRHSARRCRFLPSSLPWSATGSC